jgi:hypothetical protein
VQILHAGAATPSTQAEFTYDPADPFAVTAIFHTDSDTDTGAVSWTFARELLIDGRFQPTGEGDIRIWPCLGPDGSAVVILELSPEENPALIQLNARDTAAFVREMLTSVPLGAETPAPALDTELADLLD